MSQKEFSALIVVNPLTIVAVFVLTAARWKTVLAALVMAAQQVDSSIFYGGE